MKSLFLAVPALGLLLSGCVIDESISLMEQNRQAIECSTQAICENVRAIEEANAKIEENRRQLERINQTLSGVAK